MERPRFSSCWARCLLVVWGRRRGVAGAAHAGANTRISLLRRPRPRPRRHRPPRRQGARDRTPPAGADLPQHAAVPAAALCRRRAAQGDTAGPRAGACARAGAATALPQNQCTLLLSPRLPTFLVVFVALPHRSRTMGMGSWCASAAPCDGSTSSRAWRQSSWNRPAHALRMSSRRKVAQQPTTKTQMATRSHDLGARRKKDNYKSLYNAE